MKVLFTAFCFLVFLGLRAQRVVDVDKAENINESMFQAVGGEPYVNVKFVRLVEGTPYFNDNWLKGIVVLSNDRHTAPGLLKLNLMDDELHYLDKKKQEMIATTPVKEIILTDTLINASFHFIHSSAFPSLAGVKKGWYLQLTSGRARLFKFFKKQLLEQRPYGYATVEQTIQTSEEFYVLKDGTLSEIKKARDIPGILGDNKPEVENYLKKLGNGATSDKMAAVINFYNSLQ